MRTTASLPPALCTAIALVIALPQNLPAQRTPAAKAPTLVEVGTRAADGQPLPAKRYAAGGFLESWSVNPAGQTLTLYARDTDRKQRRFKPKGQVVQFDTDAGEVLWTRPHNYVQAAYRWEGNTLLYVDAKRTRGLDPRTHRERWSTDSPFVRTTAGGEVVLTRATKIKNKVVHLEGRNATTGRLLWERDVPSEFGWDAVVEPDDSSLIIMASGLHAIDARTGSGWSDAAVTGERNPGATAGKAALGVVTGVLFGAAMVPTDVDRTYGFVSNLVRTGGAYVYASADTLRRLDLAGEHEWAVLLPAEVPSRTLVLTAEDAYVVVSTGSASRNGAAVPHGEIYVAAYDTLDGRRRYLTQIPQAKKDVVQDVDLHEGQLSLKLTSAFYRLDATTGEIGIQRRLSVAQAEAVAGFAGPLLFRRDSTRFVAAGGEDRDALHVFRTEGGLLALDDAFEATAEIPGDRLYRAVGGDPDRYLLSDGETCVLTDKAGEEILRLPGSLRSRLLDGQIYAVEGEVVFVLAVE